MLDLRMNYRNLLNEFKADECAGRREKRGEENNIGSIISLNTAGLWALHAGPRSFLVA